MKRIFLFLVTNLAVMVVLGIVGSIIMSLLGVRTDGYSLGGLLVICAFYGFAGSIISLLMSKMMAKRSVGAQVINPNAPANETERWLLDTVSSLAKEAGVKMPEVAIYQGEPNAFATGAFKNDALVAVSTGLLQSMNKEEVEAVLGHEMAHVANGDMVTLTLIQGVVNTFVLFLARVIASLINNFLSRDGSSNGLGWGAYFAVVTVLQIVFGVLASMIVAWFSRYREFRADAGSAQYLKSPTPMIHALQRLGGAEQRPDDLPKNMNAFGIRGGKLASLFASHPPLEKRIEALQQDSAK